MNRYEIYPNNVDELNLSMLADIATQLDSGVEVVIKPDKWNKPEQAADSEDECDCPACRAKRATAEHFRSNYSENQIEEFFDSGELPSDMQEYFQSLLDDYLAETIDSVVGDNLANIPVQDLVHIKDFPSSAALAVVPRFSRPVVVNYLASRKLPNDHCLILGAPRIMKMLEPNCPDYLILGNLDKNVATNLKKSIENYSYNYELVRRFKDKIWESDGSSMMGLLSTLF